MKKPPPDSRRDVDIDAVAMEQMFYELGEQAERRRRKKKLSDVKNAAHAHRA